MVEASKEALLSATMECDVASATEGETNLNYEIARGSGVTRCKVHSHTRTVPRQFVYGHFVYDTSSTDISSTTVYQGTGQLYIQLLFQQIIIFINSNFYLHYDSLC